MVWCGVEYPPSIHPSRRRCPHFDPFQPPSTTTLQLASSSSSSLPQGCYEVSRTLYAVLLETFPSKEPIWRAAAQLEMQHGTPQQVWTEGCVNLDGAKRTDVH